MIRREQNNLAIGIENKDLLHLAFTSWQGCTDEIQKSSQQLSMPVFPHRAICVSCRYNLRILTSSIAKGSVMLGIAVRIQIYNSV